jgi:hypothetical protein
LIQKKVTGVRAARFLSRVGCCLSFEKSPVGGLAQAFKLFLRPLNSVV